MGSKSKGHRKIIPFADQGYHNEDLTRAAKRLEQGGSYKDQSVVAIFPNLQTLSARCVARWFDLMVPMNQKFFRIWPMKEWIDDAYNKSIELILGNPELSKWKYVLTIEADNVPPPNALLLLLESIQHVDVVGSLYWTKGEMGQPMIYGDPNEIPFSFRPQKPVLDALQPCNGLGMGFTLFKMDVFKDTRIARPWFKTEQSYSYGVGARSYTQDLFFFEKARAVGYKIACDTRVRVGHYDAQADKIW
jgi:hypothetical protein